LKNSYEIRGNITAIIIESRVHGRIETLIDTTDLKKAQEANSWWVNYSKDTKTFYVNGRIRDTDGRARQVSLHRYILDITDPKVFIDHIYHDTLDNRQSRIRVVTPSENNQNARIPSDNTSGHKGVYFDTKRKKWRVCIGFDGKTKSLGRFDSLVEAVIARNAAEKKYFGYKQTIA